MRQLNNKYVNKLSEKSTLTQSYRCTSVVDVVVSFVFIFTLIFAPKIGPIDLSIGIPLLLLLTCLRFDLRVGRSESIFFIFFFIILFYQIFISLYYGIPDLQPIARLIRGLMQAVLLYLFMASSPLMRIKNGLDFFYFCALAHSIIIILGAVIPDINTILSVISGNEKSPSLRSSGLLAGFDISGMISFVALIYFLVFKSSGSIKFVDVFFLSVVFLGCVFTSRVSIFFGGFIVCCVLLNFVRSKELSLIYKLLSGLFLVTYTLLFLFCTIVIIEFSFELGIIEIPIEVYSELTYVFAANSFETLLSMFFLPDSILNTIFGLGQEVAKTDVGYIINVYRFGFFGIFLAIITYCYVVFSAEKGKMRRFLLYFLAVTLLLNFKNDYIFVRGVLPVYLFFYFYSILSKEKRR